MTVHRANLSRDDGFDDNEDDFFAYAYDHENRLISVEYDYDGDGVVQLRCPGPAHP